MENLSDLKELVDSYGYSTEYINKKGGFKFIDEDHSVTVYFGKKGIKVVCSEINTTEKWYSLFTGKEAPPPIVISDDLIKYSIDGSYNHKYEVASFAWICSDGTSHGEIIENPHSRQIDGEYRSCISAVKDAIKKNYEVIVIEYDYSGVAYIINGYFEAKTDLSKEYKNIFNKLISENNIDVLFSKVRGHKGIETNEAVDALAKKTIVDYIERKSK